MFESLDLAAALQMVLALALLALCTYLLDLRRLP
jgi:hypothetical protein